MTEEGFFEEEVLFDHHAILGFRKAKQVLTKQGYKVIDPFPAPGKETRDFFWKMNNQVMFENVVDGKSRPRLRRYALGNAKVLMEILLWKRIGCRNSQKIGIAP